MVRYVIDPFSFLIQDCGTGEHDVDQLRRVFTQLMQDGKTLEDLIELVMESFGLTATEAEALVRRILGLDDPEDEPSPSPSW